MLTGSIIGILGTIIGAILGIIVSINIETIRNFISTFFEKEVKYKQNTIFNCVLSLVSG